MHVTATTLRGRGVELVSKDTSVDPNNLRLLRRSNGRIRLVIDSGKVTIDGEEIDAINGFLSENGVRIEAINSNDEKWRAKLRGILTNMAKQGWLSDKGLAGTEKFREP